MYTIFLARRSREQRKMSGGTRGSRTEGVGGEQEKEEGRIVAQGLMQVPVSSMNLSSSSTFFQFSTSCSGGPAVGCEELLALV